MILTVRLQRAVITGHRVWLLRKGAKIARDHLQQFGFVKVKGQRRCIRKQPSRSDKRILADLSFPIWLTIPKLPIFRQLGFVNADSIATSLIVRVHGSLWWVRRFTVRQQDGV
jgi:hypothetical protein